MYVRDFYNQKLTRFASTIKPDQFDQIPSSLSQYHQAKQFRSAEYIPSSAGGFNRISRDTIPLDLAFA